MRRKYFFIFTLLFCSQFTFAQFQKGPMSFGVKGGLNLSSFRTPLSYSTYSPDWNKLGGALGAYLETPVSKRFSVQGEALYSAMGSRLTGNNGLEVHRYNYFSLPFFAKFKVSNGFKVFAGIQGDILLRARRWEKQMDRVTTITEQTRDFDFGFTGGAEVTFSPKVALQLRYMHGTHDVSIYEDTYTAYNQGVQVALQWTLFNCKHSMKKVKK